MPSPKLKTQDMLHYLVDCINTHTKPSQFEAKKIEREAKKLPTAHDSNIVLGYLAIALEDYQHAETHFENALRSTLADDATVEDLAMMYERSSRMRSAQEVLIRALKAYPNSIHINRSLYELSLQGLDIEQYLHTLKVVEKMELKFLNRSNSQTFERLISLHGRSKGDIKRLKRVGDEVFKLVEKHQLIISSLTIMQLPETNHTSFIYKVIARKSDIGCFDLNWGFAEQIVDADLLDVPVVINFQIIDPLGVKVEGNL